MCIILFHFSSSKIVSTLITISWISDPSHFIGFRDILRPYRIRLKIIYLFFLISLKACRRRKSSSGCVAESAQSCGCSREVWVKQKKSRLGEPSATVSWLRAAFIFSYFFFHQNYTKKFNSTGGADASAADPDRWRKRSNNYFSSLFNSFALLHN